MNKNKLVIYILSGILVFLIVFLYLQVGYDKNKNIIGIKPIEITQKTEIVSEEIYEVPNINNSKNKNKYDIYDYNKYFLNDTIKLNIPSESSNYNIDNLSINLINGIMNVYNLKIMDYEIDSNNYLNITLEINANNESAKNFISSKNFKLNYKDNPLENLTNTTYEISKETTVINLSYKLSEDIIIEDINVQFFKLIYEDNFNIKRINLYMKEK